MMRRCGLLLAILGVAFAQRLQFEVASVKVDTDSRGMDVAPRRSGDRVTMHNTQIYSLIYYAYHLTGSYQMVDFPDLPDPWRWWDIEARVGRDATDDEVRLMLQSLLEDRFKLKAHREKRELPAYELVIDKDKPKLTPAHDGPMVVTIEERRVPVREGTCGTTLWLSGSHMDCHKVTIDQIVAELRGHLGAPLVDKTGLTGSYDVDMVFVPEKRKQKLDADVVLGPSLEEAVKETLGLRLVKGKGPVDVLVIEHLEKASEN